MPGDSITEGISLDELVAFTKQRERTAHIEEIDKFDDKTLWITVGSLSVTGLLAVIGGMTLRNLKKKGTE